MSTLPRTLIPPFSGNLYAPIWAGVTPQLPGYCDVEFDFDPIQVTLSPGQTSYKNRIDVNADADYLCREIYCAPIGGTTIGASGQVNPKDLKIRITDGDGNFITSDWITANDLTMPVGPGILPLRKGSTCFVDLWNRGDGTLIVQMGFKGVKRFPCDSKQGPIPPFYPASARYCNEQAGERFEDYEYYYEMSNGANPFFPPWTQNLQPQSPNNVFRQFTLPTDDDADFLLRGITGMIMSSGSPVSQLGQECFLTFYDPAIVPMAREVQRIGQVPVLAGPGAELVLSNGGGRMNPIFPEQRIPRGSTVSVDIGLTLDASTVERVEFSLRGVKVYRAEDCAF